MHVMCAADFRRIARDSLRGKWIIAVLVGLVATLLGGTAAGGPDINLKINDTGAYFSVDLLGQTIFSTSGSLDSGLGGLLVMGATYILILSLVLGLVLLVVGSFVEVGYAKVNLELVDGQSPSFETLFAYRFWWTTTLAARLWQTLYILLWSLLFIIPGIMAAYSYAMTGFILAENPHLPAREAMRRSKELMDGNRWRLFCLGFSFIGWMLLSGLIGGIGNLLLTPYRQAASAAFYRELTGSPPLDDAPLEQISSNAQWDPFEND